MKRVVISKNRRFLMTEDGEPFFWLGDTAWELFHRLSRAEAARYLENRRQRGFNVIQAVALAELDGLNTPNADGERPLIDNDPARPNEAYWKLVDDIIDMAASRDIHIGLLPTWGDKVTPMWGTGPAIFTVDNARDYGRWIGARYAARPNVLWIIGGDRPEVGDGVDFAPIWRAMAGGIQESAAADIRPFFTYHPCGGHGSSETFHFDDWLSMNMWQSGHGEIDARNWEMITGDYQRVPIKPVLDGEPNYEDHPINPFTRKWNVEHGLFSEYDVRKQAYRAVFAGACGHTYGHHAVWQMYTAEREPINYPYMPWYDAIERPGAAQLIHLKRLLLSRPYFERIPDQSLLVTDAGERARHARATRAEDGSYALVYIPEPARSFTIDLGGGKLSGSQVNAAFFDPRNGAVLPIGQCATGGQQNFTTPGAGLDWVLVLDDADRGFGAPGSI